jgi:hypothetical protein
MLFYSVLRTSYSGVLRRVTLIRTDVSEEISTSIIRVTRIGELVTANVSSSPILVTLMMEVLSFSEMSFLIRATQGNIQEDAILHSHRREHLKSYSVMFPVCFTNISLSNIIFEEWCLLGCYAMWLL